MELCGQKIMIPLIWYKWKSGSSSEFSLEDYWRWTIACSSFCSASLNLSRGSNCSSCASCKHLSHYPWQRVYEVWASSLCFCVYMQCDNMVYKPENCRSIPWLLSFYYYFFQFAGDGIVWRGSTCYYNILSSHFKWKFLKSVNLCLYFCWILWMWSIGTIVHWIESYQISLCSVTVARWFLNPPKTV